jgi:predicted nuclease of predicted toxin-antitoxin system
MKILIDMNLTPMWVVTFQNNGYEAVHWSSVGKPTASDDEIMKYALQKEFVVFTHDLDFGDISAIFWQQREQKVQVLSK